MKQKRTKKIFRKIADNMFERHVKCRHCTAMFHKKKARDEHERIFHSDCWQQKFKG